MIKVGFNFYKSGFFFVFLIVFDPHKYNNECFYYFCVHLDAQYELIVRSSYDIEVWVID